MALYIPEIPPVLRGTEQEQIQALRDYLIRTTRTLSEILNRTGTGQLSGTGSAGAGTGGIQAGELAKVATSGEYSDLKNRPSLANVATSGLYGDLSGTPPEIFVADIETAYYADVLEANEAGKTVLFYATLTVSGQNSASFTMPATYFTSPVTGKKVFYAEEIFYTGNSRTEPMYKIRVTCQDSGDPETEWHVGGQPLSNFLKSCGVSDAGISGSYADLADKPLGSNFALYKNLIVGGYSNPGDTEFVIEADPPALDGFKAMGIIGFEWDRTCAPLYPINMNMYVPGNKIKMKFGFFEPYQGTRYNNVGIVYILYVRTSYPT